MEIRFFITEQSVNDMDIVDYEAFERAQDGDVKIYRIRPAVCRFMVDENNIPIPYNQALKASEKMKLKDFKDFINKFFETMQGSAIPKSTGSELKSPTEAVPVDSLYQVGLER